MTDQVEKTAEAVQPLIDKLSEYLAAAEKVVVERAPDVWDATLTIIQLRSIVSLVAVSIATAIAVIITRKAFRLMREEHKKSWTERADFLAIFAPIACGVVCILLTFAWIGSFDWWLGAFAPEYAVLYSIATKLGIL